MSQRRRGQRPGLSRREFLAAGGAAGVALGLPGLLAGCGSDDNPPPAHPATATATATPQATATPTPVPRPREQRTLHFDFSFGDVSEPRLRVLLSAHDGLALTPHTAETRAFYRQQNPLLRGVADARLTHFCEAVDLPADSLQHFWLTGRHLPSGGAALLGLQIHVPQAVRRTLATHQRVSGQPRLHGAKLRAYGLGQVADELALEDLAPTLDEFVTPWDTAAALVFHHPEIMNLNLEQGAAIKALIETLPCTAADQMCEPFLSTLAFRIANHWPATTTAGGWATLVPLIDPDTGEPLLDEHEQPVYRTDLADETVAAAQQTIRAVLRAIFDDPRFEGNNWHEVAGRTVQSVRRSAGGAAQMSGFELVAEHPAGTSAHGLDFVDFKVTDAAKRTLELRVRNWHLRTHALHVQFSNAAGPLPVKNPGDADSVRAKHLGLAITANTILAVPVPIDVQTFVFDVPIEASKATVFFGSLGVGGDPFCPEAVLGSVLTIVFNLILPAIALALGIAGELSVIFRVLKENSVAVANIVAGFVRNILITAVPSLARGVFGAAASGSASDFFVALANLGAQLLLRVLVPILALIGQAIFRNQAPAVFSIAFISPGFLAAAATAVEIIETVSEVLASPALFTNTLSLVMTTTVRVEHDPNDFRFPARARHYEVTLVYDEASKVAHKLSGVVEADRVDPIAVVFEKVPSGGKVTVDVVLTTAEGYIIGRSVDAMGKEGPVGPIPNTPEMAGTIVVPIKERLIPLTQGTRYLHDLELKVENGHRVWVEGPAPTATRAVLCQGQDDRLCNLGGITINQRTGMAGYGFQAGGQGDRKYCGESGGGVMYLFQNIFLAANPEQGLKALPCGFRHPAGIVYDKLGPQSGRHFFLEPAADGLSYFLESVVLDRSTPFQLNNPLAWGRFTQALESLAVVPTGYVVGVSRLTHKMEILQLPTMAVDRAQAPEAVPFAVLKGGEGTREGLMSAPVAVAVLEATILVLETGNARIQAFDVSANPVRLFKNGTSATVELEKTPNLEYLDIAVEGLGYIYVLSAANGGLNAGDYRLDVFTPQGNLLNRTTGVAAARMAVDTFRNVYALNYASLAGAPRVEPSLSQWVPSTP